MDHARRRLALVAMATAGLLAVAGCGGDDSENSSDGPVMSVSADDFSFDAPETVAAGPTTVRLTNDGEEDHELHLLRLNGGVEVHQFRQALHQDGLDVAMRLGSTVGHVATVGPGQTTEAAVDLPEGEYVLICQLPSPGDGVAHILKGMVKDLTVAGGG